MANYKESTVSGTSYIRSHSVSVANPLNGVKAINFYEEQVINFADGEQMFKPFGGFQEPLTAENAVTEFALVNPVTGQDSGVKMTYQDLYVALYSLYVALAAKRDAGATL